MGIRSLLLCVLGSMLAVGQSQALVPLDPVTAGTTVGGQMCFQGATKECPEHPDVRCTKFRNPDGTYACRKLLLLSVAYCATVPSGFYTCHKVYFPPAPCWRAYIYDLDPSGGCSCAEGTEKQTVDCDWRWASTVLETGPCPSPPPG